MHDFCEFNHGKRILRCRLHNNRATNGKSRCNFASHVDNGEVIRRDTGHNTHWLTLNNATDESTSGAHLVGAVTRGRRARCQMHHTAHGQHDGRAADDDASGR